MVCRQKGSVPQNILDKIYQPPSDCVIRAGFFTTTPTGQGTGLGLSLSYDFVKAHGGKISVRNNEEAEAGFAIVLRFPTLSQGVKFK